MSVRNFDGSTLPILGDCTTSSPPSRPPVTCSVSFDGTMGNDDYSYLIDFETEDGKRTNTTATHSDEITVLDTRKDGAILLTSIEQPTDRSITKINLYRYSTNVQPNYYLVGTIPVGQTSFLDVTPDSALV